MPPFLAAENPPVAEYTAYGVILLIVVAFALKGIPAIAAWVDRAFQKMQSTLERQQETFSAAIDKMTGLATDQQRMFQEEMKANRHTFAQQIQQRDNEIDKQRERTIEILREREQSPQTSGAKA